MHRGAFCQFLFRWIYYYGSNKSTGKETCKPHLCAVHCSVAPYLVLTLLAVSAFSDSKSDQIKQIWGHGSTLLHVTPTFRNRSKTNAAPCIWPHCFLLHWPLSWHFTTLSYSVIFFSFSKLHQVILLTEKLDR